MPVPRRRRLGPLQVVFVFNMDSLGSPTGGDDDMIVIGGDEAFSNDGETVFDHIQASWPRGKKIYNVARRAGKCR